MLLFCGLFILQHNDNPGEGKKRRGKETFVFVCKSPRVIISSIHDKVSSLKRPGPLHGHSGYRNIVGKESDMRTRKQPQNFKEKMTEIMVKLFLIKYYLVLVFPLRLQAPKEEARSAFLTVLEVLSIVSHADRTP